MLKSSLFSFTNLSRIIIVFVVLNTLFAEQRWTREVDVIKADVRGYYTYLPALFIYDDILLEHPEEFPEEIWYVDEPGNNRYIKYSIGPAIFYTPFFLVAHQLAEPLGYEANGYTAPYRFGVVMSAFAFLLLALLFLGKLLRKHFTDLATAGTLLVVFLGSNVWTYSVNEMAYPHLFSLSLVSMFCYFGASWLEDQRNKWTILTGLLAGLMVLTRPVDAIFLVFFLLYQVRSFDAFKERIVLIKNSFGKIGLMIAMFVLAISPQFIYYKVVFDDFFYFTYREEGFFFSNPQLYSALFDFRNGYLIYSPLMVFSLIGFFFLRKHSGLKWFSITAVGIYIFVISSWWCWWYVGFGNRSFINVAPISALPMAAFFQWALSKGKWLSFVLLVIIYGGIQLNMFQADQLTKGLIHWDAMTFESYKYALHETASPQAVKFKIEYPSYDSAMVGKDYVRILELQEKRSYRVDFNKVEQTGIIEEHLNVPFQLKNGQLMIPEGHETLFEYKISIKEVDHIRFSATVESEEHCKLIVTSEVNPEYNYSSKYAEHIGGDWHEHELYVDLVNANRRGVPLDSVKVILSNPSKQALNISAIEVIAGYAEFSEYVEN